MSLIDTDTCALPATGESCRWEPREGCFSDPSALWVWWAGGWLVFKDLLRALRCRCESGVQTLRSPGRTSGFSSLLTGGGGGLNFGGMVSPLSYLLSCGLSLAGAAQPGILGVFRGRRQ